MKQLILWNQELMLVSCSGYNALHWPLLPYYRTPILYKSILPSAFMAYTILYSWLFLMSAIFLVGVFPQYQGLNSLYILYTSHWISHIYQVLIRALTSLIYMYRFNQSCFLMLSSLLPHLSDNRATYPWASSWHADQEPRLGSWRASLKTCQSLPWAEPWDYLLWICEGFLRVPPLGVRALRGRGCCWLLQSSSCEWINKRILMLFSIISLFPHLLMQQLPPP